MGAETSLSEAEREIEATRRRIQDTAGSLEDRLKPRALLRPVQKRLEETLGAGGGKILDAFREHPLPLALAGLGLGWLLLRDLRRPPAAKAEDVAPKAKEAVSDWFSTALEEKPMLLAVGALAAGLLAAVLVPATPREEKKEAAPESVSILEGNDAPPAT